MEPHDEIDEILAERAESIKNAAKMLDDLHRMTHALEAIKWHIKRSFPSGYKGSAIYRAACRGLGEEK